MWEMERDGVDKGVKEKRSQLDHQHLAHQSSSHQSKCGGWFCRLVAPAASPMAPGLELLLLLWGKIKIICVRADSWRALKGNLTFVKYGGETAHLEWLT